MPEQSTFLSFNIKVSIQTYLNKHYKSFQKNHLQRFTRKSNQRYTVIDPTKVTTNQNYSEFNKICNQPKTEMPPLWCKHINLWNAQNVEGASEIAYFTKVNLLRS